MKYHNIYRDYIHQRLAQHRDIYRLCILIVLCDIPHPESCLSELTKVCLLTKLTLVLTWSFQEVAQYVETCKSRLNQPADVLMERPSQDTKSRILDFLTSIRALSRTDALVLLRNFKNVRGIVGANFEELSMCPGIGPSKASRIRKFFRQPFYKDHIL